MSHALLIILFRTGLVKTRTNDRIRFDSSIHKVVFCLDLIERYLIFNLEEEILVNRLVGTDMLHVTRILQLRILAGD